MKNKKTLVILATALIGLVLYLITSLTGYLVDTPFNAIPVVCTAVGGMTNIILNDYNGLMVKPNSVEALKNSLEKLIKDPALRATLAKNAHTTVSQSFSLEKWEERWSLVLNDIKKLS